MKTKGTLGIGLTVVMVALALLTTGCIEDTLAPWMSYQGRLTDETGDPLDGTVNLTIGLYDDEAGGTLVHSEVHNDVPVNDGLFDMTIGPTGFGSLSPEDLTHPLWMAVTVDDGVHTETLSPRQRLLGSPYAFTLMPSAVISGTLDTLISGANNVDAVVTVRNTFEDAVDNPALPALLVRGEKGLMIAGREEGNEAGTIYADPDVDHADLEFYSSDNFDIYLDSDDASSNGIFGIYRDNGAVVYQVFETGNTWAAGTKSAIVQVEDEQRLMYAVESAEVWFEDLGAGALQEGAAVVSIDSLFAKTVDLGIGYHVFLTPLGDCNGLYVTNKTDTGFEVRELGGGLSSVSFDYRIMAHRLGYGDLRMELGISSMAEGEVD
ncbi:MAG: hypothetical protein MUQ10_17220 [Anaerolineae bacterium]|nr:hypothetical protein [Anaerolineae bacterium]